jgi:hypothetical protein
LYAVDGGVALLTDMADATDGDLLIPFFQIKKKEEEEINNMRMAVSAVGLSAYGFGQSDEYPLQSSCKLRVNTGNLAQQSISDDPERPR